jgi:hypothetical protein
MQQNKHTSVSSLTPDRLITYLSCMMLTSQIHTQMLTVQYISLKHSKSSEVQEAVKVVELIS